MSMSAKVIHERDMKSSKHTAPVIAIDDHKYAQLEAILVGAEGIILADDVCPVDGSIYLLHSGPEYADEAP